ncbi:MAG: lamin tail domain-containing protein, partial [Kiritimatiellae bacterium]|nr:lamin tail domain-containing protein [Kiritimatiellia bacterium]
MSKYCFTRHRPIRARLARLYWLVALFLVPFSPLCAQVVINEIMYHPLEPWPDTQPYKTTNLTEFIEILNAGTQSVDLATYRFDNGVSFTFDVGTTLNPGAYGVICEDFPAFTNTYPTVTNLLGEYNGTLRNGGERITLSHRPDATWVEADSIAYLDDDAHDGTGKSMELIHPGFHPLRNHYYGDWSASTPVGGTPGVQNSVYNAAPLPVAGDIRHDPPLPFGGSSIEITAHVQGRDGHDVNTVLLEYRLDARNDAPTSALWTNAPMQDGGTDGDAIASNGVYTAMLPEFGATPMQSGDIIEYRVKVTDDIGTMTFPATNRAGVLSGPFSYLVKFEDDNCIDCAYQDEYPTYHIIMRDTNKALLETRDKNSNVLLDGTLVTSDGFLYHNCGIRFRGKSSRNSLLGSYRIELPNGETYEDSSQLSLNQQNAMLQYLGMKAHSLANDGYGSTVKLARVFLGAELKHPSHAIYVKIEAFSDEYVQRLHPDHDQLGNRYWTRQQAGFDGDLSFINSNEVSYHSEYLSDINNHYTGYEDLLDVIIDIDQPVETYPTILSNHINQAQWGGYFGIMAAIDNQEAGFGSPTGTKGDELKCYVRPDGKAELLPWDMDAVFGTQLNLYSWGTTTVPKFLLNPPMIHHYLGKVYDAGVNVLTDEAMNEILDDMGSKMAASKATYFNNTITRRGLIEAQILTNLTINGFAPGANAIAVSAKNVGDLIIVEPVNQGLYSGEWVFLGSLSIQGTPLQSVTVTRQHAHPFFPTVADALMFSNAVHGVTIIDDDDPGFSTIGSGWTTAASGGYNNGPYHKVNTEPGFAMATWSATSITQAGTYDVYAWLNNGNDSLSRYALEAATPGISVSLSGTAPQNYTQRVLLNTHDAAWDARSNQWTTVGDPLLFTRRIAPVTVSAVDVDGNTTAIIDFTAYSLDDQLQTNGVISGDVTWSSE